MRAIAPVLIIVCMFVFAAVMFVSILGEKHADNVCSARGMELRTWREGHACVGKDGLLYDPTTLERLDRGRSLLGP